MAGRLKGRHIVITGAAAGIGQAIAALFAAEGAQLALLDRDYDKLAGGPGHPIQVDVADERSVADAVDAAAKALTRIDGLVNAAGIFPISPLAETSLEQWQRTIEVNLTGPFLMCRAALPHMRACDAATIVNLGSASAIVPFAGLGAYAASKGGLATFTKVLAAELAPKIRANVLCPGMTRTRMVSDWYPDQYALTERAQALYPLQRIAEPSEIAAAALFLTSQESSFITGTTLTVDGGRTFH
jgi:NAD(P)-dependent dehydrogenase (short-subunit alcohol dehydrogenase family)